MAERSALVTGASRGIGLAIAEVLAEDGYGLTLTARKPDTLAETAAALSAKGYEVQYLAADMADEEGLKAVVELHDKTYGRLDVLVNNAGVGIGAPAGEQKTKFIDMQMDVNVRSIIFLYREEYYLWRDKPERKAGDSEAQFLSKLDQHTEAMDRVRGQALAIIAKARDGSPGRCVH